ncbi:hypothetical protein BHM03_00000318 [Ensete ventricosum]|uniref:K+ potassium transporter integral membrane domain-containing protein n=1 Tax=Ensete ventricosum TaxID=4639 RepID=A0A445M8C4_ENSVE|nr:hypothetical protein BHM03_00000318 [Ensete ventricosum]
MYSLICRHAKVSAIPNQQAEDDELSACKAKLPNKNTKRAKKVIEALENSSWAKTILLSLTLFGTCMVIGDGILTPCISDVVALVSVAVLVLLFSVQRFGTDKVGYTFAPAILIWCLFIGIIGISNLIRHDSTVVKAFNPIYIISYLKRNPKEAWISLGGVVLCITGTEAIQAMISATFAIVKQSMALGCFPRVRVVHTSHKHGGQVYIPEINFLLMFACFMVIASFRETSKIGNAYGNALCPSVRDLPWTNCCFRAPQGSRWSR